MRKASFFKPYNETHHYSMQYQHLQLYRKISNLADQRKFMDEIAIKLNIQHWQDWNKVTSKQIRQHGGWNLLKWYNGSPLLLLSVVYPEHPWDHDNRAYGAWRPGSTVMAHGYWNDMKNQRKFMDELRKKLNITKWEDWRAVTQNQIATNGGRGLLWKYNYSPLRLLENVYPEQDWTKINFGQQRGHLKDISNQRKLMDELGKKLGIKQIKDWNKVTWKQIHDNGGGGLLNMYNGSPLKLLAAIYPEHHWVAIDRRNIPIGFFHNKRNQRNFMEDLAIKLNITHWTDWAFVPRKTIEDYGGRYLICLYGTRNKLLQNVYPEHNWAGTFVEASSIRKSQWYLHKLLRKIIPEHQSLSEYKYPDLWYEQKRSQNIELDIFFPSLSLAFEYQGSSHYFDFPSRKHVDQLKKSSFPTHGITLLSIPYWWDGMEDSLVATVQSARPDIKLTTSSTGGVPITEDIPLKIQQNIKNFKMKNHFLSKLNYTGRR